MINILSEKQFKTPYKERISSRKRMAALAIKRHSNGLCVRCGEPNDMLPLRCCSICADKKKVYYKLVRAHTARVKHKWRWSLKFRAMQKVSGKEEPECCVCGIKDIRVLTFNHLNGHTKSEMKEYRCHPQHFHKDIIDGKVGIEDLDVRCFNHNVIYEYERGILVVPQ